MNTLPLVQSLQKVGVRITHTRLAILRVLADASEHLKVAEVHRRAKQIDGRIGLASVYRTMDLLTRLRLIKHVHMDHRHRHYARATDGHCHHLVCRSCGTVVEFSDCQVDRLVRTLARRTQFRIEGHCMDFFGQCPDCRARTEDSSHFHRSKARASRGHPA